MFLGVTIRCHLSIQHRRDRRILFTCNVGVHFKESFGRAVHREYFSSTFSSQSMLIATGCNFKMGNYYQVLGNQNALQNYTDSFQSSSGRMNSIFRFKEKDG